MIGPQLSRADVDQTAAQITRQLFSVMSNIQRFNAWLAATPDATLTGFGMSSTDVATLKSAFTDADKLRQVFEGSTLQAPAYDFRTFLGQALGVGLF